MGTQPIGGVEATALLDGNRRQEGGFSKDECRSFVWIELFFLSSVHFPREKACQIHVSFFFSSRVRLEGKNLIVSYSIFSFTGEGGGIGSLFLSYFFFSCFQLLRQ